MLKSVAKILSVLSAFAVPAQVFATIFPDNDLNRQDDVNRRTEVTEKVFNQTLDKLEAIYKPIVAKLGGEFFFERYWEESTVNGLADREGNKWSVQLSGALARVPDMKPDFFAFQACHELGHHVAGFPFYDEVDWVATESEADYYASRVCLKKLWADETAENARVAQNAKPIVTKICNDAWKSETDRNLCARVVVASDGYAKFYARLRGWYKPEIDTPEPFKVYATFETHAKSQAKLDIYVAGALCNARFDDKKVPGYKVGTHNGIDAERDAAKYSCHEASGFSEGLRPRSFFKPAIDFDAAKVSSFRVGGENQYASALKPGGTAQVSFALQNKTNRVTTRPTGYVQSLTPGITVVQPNTTFPDITPSTSSMNNAPVVIAADASVACGTPFDLRFSANTENAGSNSARKRFVVGSTKSEFVKRNNNQVMIPTTGQVSSSIDSTYSGPTRRVKIRASMVHQYGRDMKIFINGPDGSRRFVTSPNDEEDDIISISEDIDMPVANSAGQWTLDIIDDQPFSSGRMIWWELELTSAVCR